MNKTFEYIPSGGVCSRKMTITVEGSRIVDVATEGGCHGNRSGLAALLRGMEITDAVARMKGIKCKSKDTSCPDQLARALERLINN